MIAPLEQRVAETTKTRRHLRLARRLVASTFFRRDPQPGENAPPISFWRAWLYAAWVAIVIGVYFATLLGWLP